MEHHNPPLGVVDGGKAIDRDAEVRRLQQAIRRMYQGRVMPQWVRDICRDDLSRYQFLPKLVQLVVEAKGSTREDRLALSLALHSLAESVEPTSHLSRVELEMAHAEADAAEEVTEAECYLYPTEGNLARRREALFMEGSRALALAHRIDKDLRSRRSDVRLVP
jgi:hypothetical protein